MFDGNTLAHGKTAAFVLSQTYQFHLQIFLLTTFLQNFLNECMLLRDYQLTQQLYLFISLIFTFKKIKQINYNRPNQLCFMISMTLDVSASLRPWCKHITIDIINHLFSLYHNDLVESYSIKLLFLSLLHCRRTVRSQYQDIFFSYTVNQKHSKFLKLDFLVFVNEMLSNMQYFNDLLLPHFQNELFSLSELDMEGLRTNYIIIFYCEMSGKQNENLPPKRSNRLDQMRKNIQKLPLLFKRTQKLEGKLELIRKRTNSTCSSLSTHTENSQSESGQIFNIDIISEVEGDSTDLFSDTFEVCEKLGEGCNACVYRCFHKTTKKVYAVKKIKLEEQHVLRFRKDFIFLQELDHPSICRYKGLYFQGDERLAYLVMEYIPLPSLAAYVIKSEDELREIVEQLIEAIQYLHSKNICHRDIKPENILYNQVEKKIKIIDFGVSKKTFLRGARRSMLTIIGTHYYLAPEFYLGGGYDQRVDLWALGVTIYQLVVGCTPFQSEYHSQTVKNIIKGQFKFSFVKWSQYSPSLRNLVSGLLRRAEERLTLSECKTHLWMIQSESPRRAKFRRNSSHMILVNQDFHEQFKNRQSNAQSKEQGERKEQNDREVEGKPRPRLFKKISNLSLMRYDVEDSDDQEKKQLQMDSPSSS